MQPLSQQYVAQAIANLDQRFYCTDVHPGYTCNQLALLEFLRGVKPVFKTYVPVHIVPLLLFKRKQFLKNPISELIKLLIGIVRSVLFAASYHWFFMRCTCLLYGGKTFNRTGQKIVAMLGGIPLIFQTHGRQAQIALFTVYKSMETIYKMALRRKMPVKIPSGNCIFTGLALSIICYHYFNNKQTIKPSYQSLIDKLLQNC